MINHSAELLTPNPNLFGGLEQTSLMLAGPSVPEAWSAEHSFPPELLSRLEEINSTWRIIKDPMSGTAFEIAEVNTDKPANGVLEVSTFSSSLSGNPGNAFELAYHGAAAPDERRIYVATMGNGGSDNLHNEELREVRTNGRWTNEENGKVRARPTIQALQRAIASQGWQPSKLSSDSLGGNIATALMVEFEPDQISHAFMKSRTNISQHSYVKLALEMLVIEDIKNKKANYEASTDPWKLSDWMKEETIRRLPNVYGTEVQHRGSRARQLGSYLLGLSIGPLAGKPETSPAFLDTQAALARQPQALITFEFPDRDVLYKHPADYENFLIALGRTAGPNVRGLVTPGTHGAHASAPNARAARERYALFRES